MPSCEFHGFEEDLYREKKAELAQRIGKRPIAREVVFSFVPDEVEDISGQPAPFVRIFSTNEGKSRALAEIIHAMGIDVERMPPIAEFISGSS